ncbi:Cys-tRNA(Pro) deacylase [Neobacillus sp. OS1-32]|jgi:Cys-tRNA(Pro)/Cys-tRNA(Cys) deacylase|uniref:Cys-tRNA(Pro)/Cys-tRNA(Cys) deacylase n=1 Tax=Neobacillus paridis TaxID=2803862 RepID=A0ABS1TPE1_9BACI|nr:MULTISPECIES: Cys-tRNA(Pro) deacylase [Neobacillus]MBL4953221.1 Cys-tRNA(Pro) deacylase [Neobacillus paridis]WML29695.1 Cys-tRNA(Pro) deacylase [Neobacillus sp. OS1-32]
MAHAKTNAMRLLDTHKISYEVLIYDHKDEKIDGISVAAKIGKDPKEVYKTLVAQGASRNIYVFVIPVAEELDLKKAAKAAGEKNMEMVPVKDIQKWTGYIRGGCSPIGMKKQYRTFIDESCLPLDSIVVSAGKIGMQVVLGPGQLKEITGAEIVNLTK